MATRKPKALTLAERKSIILDVMLDKFNFEMNYGRMLHGKQAAEVVKDAWKSRAAAINQHVNGKTS